MKNEKRQRRAETYTMAFSCKEHGTMRCLALTKQNSKGENMIHSQMDSCAWRGKTIATIAIAAVFEER